MARPVRVLFVASHPVQYASPQFRAYAQDSRLDVTVAYCSMQGAGSGLDPDFGVEFSWDIPLLEGYPWVHPPNRSPCREIEGFFGLINPGLWQLVRSERFDVVVCYGYRAVSFWIAALAARCTASSLCFTTDAHSWDVRGGSKWKSRLKRLIIPRIFALGDAVLAPSSRTADYLRRMGIARNRVFLTPYVVDNQFFDTKDGLARSESREELGVPSSAPMALFVAKLVPWKRPKDLLEAAAGVDGLHVLIAGDGMLRGELEERADRADLRGRVHFLGFVNQSQLPSLYEASDFLVLPSEYEPFGIVVNEAFASGRTAVVSSACGCVGDLVREGDTGCVFMAGDIDALRLQLKRLTSDGPLREALAERARSRINEWGPEANVDAVVNACVEVREAMV